MKRKGIFWKIFQVIMVFTFTLCVLLLGWKWHDRKYGSSWYDEELGSTCYLERFNDGRVRVYNYRTRKNTTPRLEWIAMPCNKKDTTTVFCVKGQRGYLSTVDGKIIIPAGYEKAWQFSEGLGAVCKNGKVGFINIQGKTVIPFQFQYNPNINHKADFLFKDGSCAVFGPNGKQGLIDKQGKWILTPKYDSITDPVKGYRIVSEGAFSGAIDTLFNLILPIQYERVSITENGFAVINGKTQQVISFNSKETILPFVYDDIDELFYHTRTSDDDDTYIRSDYTSFEINKKWGLMDKAGKVVIPARYDDIKAISNDVFNCQLGNFWVTCNSKGETVN